GTLVGFVEGDRFLGDPAGVFQQLEFVNQLVTFVLRVSAEGVWIRALHDLSSSESVSGVTGAGGKLGLVNAGAFGGSVPLLLAVEVHAGFREGHAGDSA